MEDGTEGYTKYVRKIEGLLLTDTNWRDSRQYILATRMINQYLANAANFTNLSLRKSFSLNMWGGATFNVDMHFLNEYPWERLKTLREKVLDVPFQMMLYGANTGGYTNYPDKIVHKLFKQAYKSGVEVLHIHNYINYTENLNLSINTAVGAGGFM